MLAAILFIFVDQLFEALKYCGFVEPVFRAVMVECVFADIKFCMRSHSWATILFIISFFLTKQNTAAMWLTIIFLL